MAKLYYGCQLSIQAVLLHSNNYYISPKISTAQPYPDQLFKNLKYLGIDYKKQQCKVIQYKTQILKKSIQIETCVVFFVEKDLTTTPNMLGKLDKFGYKPLKEQDPICKKIKEKKFACLNFLSEEGDTVAVHQYEENIKKQKKDK